MKIGAPDPRFSTPSLGLERKKADPGRPPDPTDNAKITLSSKLVQAEGEGSFDAAKVAEIARAIREGHFKVDAEAIADKLISNARELLGGSGS